MLWPAAYAAARDVSVTVTEPGTLRECIAGVTDDFESITRLTVRGPLDPNTDNNVYYDLPNLEELDLAGAELAQFSGAQFMNALRSVKLPVSTKRIPMTGFYACPALTTIEMPGVETMAQMAIAGCPALKELRLPATLVSAYGAVFNCTGLTDVYHTAFLPEGRVVNTEQGETQTVTHHVPTASFDLYAEAFESDEHATLVAYDVKFDLLNIYKAVTLSSTSAMEGADVCLSNQEDNSVWFGGYLNGALTVASGAPWRVADFSMACEPHSTYVSYPDYDSEYYAGMTNLLVDDTPMTAAGDVSLQLTESGDTEKWTFFSLPFDARLSDLEAGPSRYVVRRFDAAARAEGAGEAWTNVGPDEMLKAHEGYIITREHSDYHYNDDYDDYGDEDDYDDYDDYDDFEDDYSPFVFHAADTPAKQDIFTSEPVEYKLLLHPAKYPHMAHWNFVGNPYPCFYSISGIQEPYNIMVFYDWNYVVVNTQDDPDTFLAPFQPFFVQARPGSETMHFAPSARFVDKRPIKYPDFASQRRADAAPLCPERAAAPGQAQRHVLNLLLTDAAEPASGQRARTDRARLVVNPAATTDYEINRDAAKMMSPRSDVPQIFISEGGMRLAIDERPVAPGTTLDLGLQVGSEREQCISLDARGAASDAGEGALSVVLTDRLTGAVVDLTTADYRFTALPGLVVGRFGLTIGAAPEGIAAPTQDSAAGAQRFDLQGRPLQPNAGAPIGIEAGRKQISR